MIGNAGLLTKGRDQGLLADQVSLKLHCLRIGTGADLLRHPLLQSLQFLNGDGANRLDRPQAAPLPAPHQPTAHRASRRYRSPNQHARHRYQQTIISIPILARVQPNRFALRLADFG